MAQETIRELSLSERRVISSKLVQHRSHLIQASSEYIKSRFGVQAFTHVAVEDAGSPIDFLAASIELGSVESFKAYTLWLAKVLIARYPIVANSNGLRAVQIRYGSFQSPLAIYFNPAERACIQIYLDVALKSLEIFSVVTIVLELEEPRARYLEYILQGKRREAYEIIAQLREAGTPLSDIYTSLLAEAQHTLGQLWESGKISETQEHAATAVTQHVMARLSATFPDLRTHRGLAVISTVPGEEHDIGALMIADLLDYDGWSVRFLGGSAPLESIVEMISRIRPSVAGFSITLLPNIRIIQRLIKRLKEEMGSAAPKIVIGGAAVKLAPNFAYEVGADGLAVDAESALALFRRLSPACTNSEDFENEENP